MPLSYNKSTTECSRLESLFVRLPVARCFINTLAPHFLRKSYVIHVWFDSNVIIHLPSMVYWNYTTLGAAVVRLFFISKNKIPRFAASYSREFVKSADRAHKTKRKQPILARCEEKLRYAYILTFYFRSDNSGYSCDQIPFDKGWGSWSFS